MPGKFDIIALTIGMSGVSLLADLSELEFSDYIWMNADFLLMHSQALLAIELTE